MTIQEDINRTLEESVTLPPGWYCSSVSVSGVGVYQRFVGNYQQHKRKLPYQEYKVSYVGFVGGWVATGRNYGANEDLFPGQAFPEYIGAIMAVEIMLADAGC